MSEAYMAPAGRDVCRRRRELSQSSPRLGEIMLSLEMG
jgi:hypothetical protein